MAHRPALAEVRLVAEGMLASEDGAAESGVRAALRLGGGTREGQSRVNLMLADVFADVLERECPPTWRTPLGVPDVVRLAAVDDEQQTADGYVREKQRLGQPAGRADGKAAVATAANAAVLAQRYLVVRRQSPEHLPRFVAEAERTTRLMVDRVWGALWIACRRVRSLPGQPDAGRGRA